MQVVIKALAIHGLLRDGNEPAPAMDSLAENSVVSVHMIGRASFFESSPKPYLVILKNNFHDVFTDFLTWNFDPSHRVDLS